MNTSAFMTMPELLRTMVARHRQRTYLVDGTGNRLTYGEFLERVEATAAALSSRIAPGDAVGLWMPNSWDWLVCQWAVWDLGGVTVPLNTRLREYDLAQALGEAAVTTVITSESADFDYLAVLASLMTDPELEKLSSVVIAGESNRTAGGGEVVRMDELMSVDRDRREPWRGEPADAACVLFTSGTTKGSKGVVLTHRSLNNCVNLSTLYQPDDVVYVAFPLFAITGLVNTGLAAMVRGCSLVIEERFGPGQALQVINRERCTCFNGVLQVFELLHRSPDWSADPPDSLRGGYVFPRREAYGTLFRDMGFTRLAGGYGLTESCGPVTNVMTLDDLTSEGQPFPGNEVDVRDALGASLPVGERGEIYVRTPYLMDRYLHEPELTAQALGADGWFRTGDIGTVDAEGRVTWLGRLSDAFKSSGYNVIASEIEHFMLRVDGVDDVAVVPVRHPVKGTAVGAYVQRAPGHENLDANTVIRACRGKIATYKVPTVVVFVDSFPRTATGKIQKQLLPALDHHEVMPSGDRVGSGASHD